jgi:hypothetical protein
VLVSSSARDVVPAGVDMARTIGWFTCRVPVWIPAGDEPPPATVRRAAAAFARVRPYRHMWGLLRRDGRLPTLPEPALTLSYLGRPDAERHEEPPAGISIVPLSTPVEDWDPADERVDPTLHRGVMIDVEAALVDERLCVNFLYSTNRHRQDTVAALADAFRDELLAALPKLATPA